MTTTLTPIESRKMKPCTLAISNDLALGTGDQASVMTRRWRAMALDTQAPLAEGRLVTNCDDPLVIVREKAVEAARGQGYEPQRFVLENS